MTITAEWAAIILVLIGMLAGAVMFAIRMANKPLAASVNKLTETIKDFGSDIKELKSDFVEMDRRLLVVETTHVNNGCTRSEE